MEKRIVPTIDSRADIGPVYKSAVALGAERVVNQLYPASGAAGSFGTQIQFQGITVPSSDTTLVSRVLRVAYDITVSFPSSDGFANASNTRMPKPTYTPTERINMVLRDFPLQTITQVATLNINNQQLSWQPREMLSAIKRTLPMEWLKGEGSTFPSKPDGRAVLLTDAVSITTAIPAIAAVPYAGANVQSAIALTSSNELSRYENSAEGWSRAAFFPKSYARDAATNTDTYVFTVSEPMLIPGCSFRETDEFFANVQQMAVTLTLAGGDALLDMVVCSGDTVVAAAAAANTLVPGAIQIQIGQSSIPRLQLTYLTMARDVLKIPARVAYPADIPQLWSTSAGTIAFNAASSQTLNSGTFTAQSLPKAIVIFARQTLSSRCRTVGAPAQCLRSPDIFLGVGNPDDHKQSGVLSLQVGSRQSLFASASAFDLYLISKKNGLNMSWSEAQRCGFPIIVVPEDFGISAELDGLPGEFTAGLQIQAQLLVNTNPYVYAGSGVGAVDCELCVMALYEGSLFISPGAALLEYGQLTPREVRPLLEQVQRHPHAMTSRARLPLYGAGLFSKVKGVFNSVKDAMNHPLAEKAADMVSSL